MKTYPVRLTPAQLLAVADAVEYVADHIHNIWPSEHPSMDTWLRQARAKVQTQIDKLSLEEIEAIP